MTLIKHIIIYLSDCIFYFKNQNRHRIENRSKHSRTQRVKNGDIKLSKVCLY